MATVIQIKRSANIAAPTLSDLVEGELAYSYDQANDGAGAKLYIEVNNNSGNTIHTIGGKYYTEAVDAATSSNTPNTLVKRDAQGSFSANVVTASIFLGNIQGQATSAAIANTANTLTTGRVINLAGDLEGNVTFDGSTDVTIYANVKADSTVLGTDTTGDYVANVLAGTGISVTNQGGETATPTVALTNTGVSADTYGGATTIPVITFDSQGRATSASNVSLANYITADSIKTLSNTTFDVSTSSNNKFSIQGNGITSYTGSGGVVVLQSSPTINVLNISDSNLNLDGGTGSFYWGGQSGVAQAGNYKAGIYGSSSDTPNSLFTFGVNSGNTMSVAVEGSMFIGTALPSNNGGLNTSYPGWLVVQSGGKFGGDIDTLGGLNLTDATNGKIQFSDGSIQRTAYTSNHLTTANVVEVTNLYFTNARARAAITSGNTILYDTSTGNITLSPSGVTATTYGGSGKVPVLTVDEFGRVTNVANIDVSTSITLGADTGSADPLNNNDVLRILGGTGIDTAVTDNTITVTLETTAVTPNTYGGASQIPVFTVDAQGRLTSAANVAVAGVTSFTASGNSFTISTADGGSFTANIQPNSVELGRDTTGAYVSSLVAGTGIAVENNSGENATPTVVNTGVVSLTGTSNEIQVSSANGSVQIGLPDDVIIGRDLSVTGNLYVTGNVVALPVEQLVVEDSLIQLANNNISTDIIDIGFYGSYNSDGGEHEHAGLFRDASDGLFRLFNGLQGSDNLTSTVNISGTGYSIATLVANLTGGTVSGLTANIAVGDGGTGRGTLTTNAVLFGQGTSAVGMATGSAGQILQLNNSGVPVFAGIDGGTY